MTIVRGELPRRDYTVLDNPTIEDDRLKFQTLGVLTFLLSKPPGWRVDASDLSRGEGREGRDSIRKSLNQLEEFGYLVREKRRNEKGQFVTECVVYDTPRTASTKPQVSPETRNQSPVSSPRFSGPLISTESNTYPLEESDNSDVDNCECKNELGERTGWIERDGTVERCACDYRVAKPSDPLVPHPDDRQAPVEI